MATSLDHQSNSQRVHALGSSNVYGKSGLSNTIPARRQSGVDWRTGSLAQSVVHRLTSAAGNCRRSPVCRTNQFDGPDATYCALTVAGRVVGGFRAIRCDRPYLGVTLFPQLATTRSYPLRSDYWEISQFGVLRDHKNLGVGLYAIMFGFADIISRLPVAVLVGRDRGGTSDGLGGRAHPPGPRAVGLSLHRRGDWRARKRPLNVVAHLARRLIAVGRVLLHGLEHDGVAQAGTSGSTLEGGTGSSLTC